MIITSINPSVEELEKSYLSKAVSSGATTLYVKNSNKFAANNRIMVGEMGMEKTEIVTVSGTTTTTLTTGATSFSHDADTPVYILRYDQVKFFRSTTGISGTFANLTTVALDVDNSELITTYDDSTGLSTYAYKIAYYHSLDAIQSDYSDAVLGSGYVRNTVGFFLDEFFREVGDPNQEVADRTEVVGWLNEVNDDLISRTAKPFSFLYTRTALTRTASVAYLAFPTDMWKFDRLEHDFDDGTNHLRYSIRVREPEDFRELTEDQDATESDETQFISLDEAQDLIRLYPTPDTTRATAYYLYYWKTFSELDSEADTFETPNHRIYKTYCLAKYYLKKSTGDGSYVNIADRHLAMYESEIRKLQSQNRKDISTPRSFRFLPSEWKGWRKY